MTGHFLQTMETPEARRASMFCELETFLASLAGETFVYVPNPGNAGDSLIAHATYQLFDSLNLDYELGDPLGVYPDRIVVFGGGGNLVPLYVDLRQFLLNNLKAARRIVVLPHTMLGHEDVLAQLGTNCVLFCREPASHAFVQEHAPQARVFLSHDVAFVADFEQTFRHARDFPLPLLSGTAFARRNIKRMLRTIGSRTNSVGRASVLNCFRGDLEAAGREIPYANVDVSTVFATGVMTKRDTLETTYRMIRFVDRFAAVRTDRLHVAILSALLGKQVELYANAYPKNRLVFEHSLADRFAGVSWCEDPPSSGRRVAWEE